MQRDCWFGVDVFYLPTRFRIALHDRENWIWNYKNANWWLVSIPWPDSAVRCSESLEELSAIRDRVSEEIACLRQNDSKSDSDLKQRVCLLTQFYSETLDEAVTERSTWEQHPSQPPWGVINLLPGKLMSLYKRL